MKFDYTIDREERLLFMKASRRERAVRQLVTLHPAGRFDPMIHADVTSDGQLFGIEIIR